MLARIRQGLISGSQARLDMISCLVPGRPGWNCKFAAIGHVVLRDLYAIRWLGADMQSKSRAAGPGMPGKLARDEV